jgi:hypothetical protein
MSPLQFFQLHCVNLHLDLIQGIKVTHSLTQSYLYSFSELTYISESSHQVGMCGEGPRYNDDHHCQLYPCTQLMNTIQLLPLYHCILCEGESSTADLLYSTVTKRYKSKYTSFETTNKYSKTHLQSPWLRKLPA